MPPKRRSEPRSAEHAALAQAIESLIAQNAGMTQETVADASGMNIRQVSELVRGQGNPTYTTLLKLSRGLGVSPGRLMSLADELREQATRR
ncbi:MAG TPA: helix-turn-helix transcriptional regulator [Solirubrobacteraceae bacterium]|nr:helix-turn-helix transcriptional regulator [Solirubrobacteraceae bacterium]